MVAVALPTCVVSRGGGVPETLYPFLTGVAATAAEEAAETTGAATGASGTALGGTGATATGNGVPDARSTGTGSGTLAGETMPIPTPIPEFTPPDKPKKRFIGFALIRAFIG